MIGDDDLARLRALDICQVVQQSGLTLVKRGRNFTTKEHDSLILFPRTNSWFWYQRGVGGDVIEWLRQTQHLDFETACQQLLQGGHATSSLPALRVADEPPPPPLDATLASRLHASMNEADVQWWWERGVYLEAQSHFLLGVYQHRIYGRCYTIPVYEAGTLVNLRLRLRDPRDPHDKYRPYDTGRGTQLFNGDALAGAHEALVVAGEIKAVVLWQYGLIAVSPTAGCGHWRPEWTEKLRDCRVIYVTYDPGEEASGLRLAEEIGTRARLVTTLGEKPDDFITTQGEQALRYHLKHAVPLAQYHKRQLVILPEGIAQALYEGGAPVAPQQDVRLPWRKQLFRRRGGKS